MGTHRSASTTIQTYISIGELNGNISADTYPEDASQSLPYFNSYVDLLKDIKEGNVTYKDVQGQTPEQEDRKSTRLNSSHQIISYAVFCLKKKTTYYTQTVSEHRGY